MTKTDEYSSVFGFKRALRGKLFLLHYGPRKEADAPARLGLVIGKKLLKRAVHRNLVKRIAREHFRLRQPDLPPRDLVLRLAAKPGQPDRQEIASEIVQLLDKLRRGSGRNE